jgi:hypothetical protein
MGKFSENPGKTKIRRLVPAQISIETASNAIVKNVFFIVYVLVKP